jgi:prevent-host-death family protein
MPHNRIAATEVREKLAEILNEVAFRGKRVVLDRHGKPVAALISVEDLELLEWLEDEIDLESAREAMAEKAGRVTWEDLRKELRL